MTYQEQSLLNQEIVNRQQFYETIGRNIRHHRRMLDLTQETLSGMVGIRRPVISDIERGKKYPSLWTILQIAQELDVAIVDLLHPNVQHLFVD